VTLHRNPFGSKEGEEQRCRVGAQEQKAKGKRQKQSGNQRVQSAECWKFRQAEREGVSEICRINNK